MKLAEYEAEIESMERGTFEPSDWAVREYGDREAATAAAARVMAAEIRRIAWSPAFQREAAELADRAQAVTCRQSSPV